MTAVLEATPQVLTGETNEKFLSEFSRLEVDLALKQMSPLKALGPDRMPPISTSNIGTKLELMFPWQF